MNSTCMFCSAGLPRPAPRHSGRLQGTIGMVVGSWWAGSGAAPGRCPGMPTPASLVLAQLGTRCWGSMLFIHLHPPLGKPPSSPAPEPPSQSHTVLLTEVFSSRLCPRVRWGTRPPRLRHPAVHWASFAPESIPISLPVEEIRMCPSCCPCSPQTGESSHKSCFILWTNKC